MTSSSSSLLAMRRGLSLCCRQYYDRRQVVMAAASSQNHLVLHNFNHTNGDTMRFFSSVDHRRNNNKVTITSGRRPPSPSEVFERTVYVHPLSQIILEYFQDYRSEWILSRGLDTGLTLHRDGSFELSLQQPQHGTITSTTENADNHNRIWTSYDEREKKHWLTVHYKGGNLHERFLLQDNLLPNWHTSRKSLPERVHMAVEEMILAIDRMDLLEDHHDDDDDQK